MEREEIERVRGDLEVIRRASGLDSGRAPMSFRALGVTLVVFGIGFTALAFWRPNWIPWSILAVIAVFLGITLCFVRAGLPGFSRRELLQMLGWLGSLLAVCLVFAVWGVMVKLPPRVLCGAELFISGVFPLPVAIASRDARTWMCGVPLMAAGLALPFVAWPVGILAGLGVALSGICYALTHRKESKPSPEDSDHAN
jgi:hypothetical protein